MDSHKPTPKGQRIAERWAVNKAEELEAALARDDGEPMRLSDVAKLHERKNPGDVSASTKKRNRELAANLVRVLDDPLPEEVDDAMALEYRNRRAAEKDRATREPIRNRTIWNEECHLKALVTWAYQWKKETGMRELRLFKLPTIRKQTSFAVHLRDDERKWITIPAEAMKGAGGRSGRSRCRRPSSRPRSWRSRGA